ncbi:hypothetical protein WP12_22660 [Sphingomonas sp. SRS2]|nr:hypothetical protein WP12_22660 [Sphingomonas sp. SRS2]
MRTSFLPRRIFLLMALIAAGLSAVPAGRALVTPAAAGATESITIASDAAILLKLFTKASLQVECSLNRNGCRLQSGIRSKNLG